jgi:hypothetical protein
VDVVFYIEIGGGGGGGRKGGIAEMLSFGEREHAISFARQIRAAGYTPKFVVGPWIAEHVRLAGFEPAVFWSPEIGVSLVGSFDPALIIGCELFNLSSESAKGLIELGRPMATLDGTSLALEINADPFQNSKYARSLILPEKYQAFRPCPINDTATDTDSVFHWSLFPSVSRTAKDEQLYERLGLDVSRKTVMCAAAPWAVVCSVAFGLEDYYQEFVSRVVGGLDACGTPIDFVFIAPYRPQSMTIEQRGAVKVHYRELLPYDLYDHLLTSCDAIVSDNIIQTSVSKAVVIGTPHLVIQNIQPSTMPYAYNMFPVKILFPREREYAQVVELAEFGDIAGIRERLVAILSDGFFDADARERRLAYLNRLRGLATPPDILKQIIGAPADAPGPAAATLSTGGCA